ncbi:MAG: ASKHA domain-containing protein [Candidatus Bathyarchaeota archaeon]|nr:ASKHA domain-containing protein [Candidatus Bathyarchaeota archaeon]
MAINVLLNPINRVLEARQGDVLLDIMRDSGVRMESLCGGKGLCGKCKVILESGEVEKISTTPDKFLSHEELDGGYYLACMVRLKGDCVFTIPAESRIEKPKILMSAELTIERNDPSSRKYHLESSPLVDSPLLVTRRRINLKGYKGIQPRADDEVYSKIQLLGDSEMLTATVSNTDGFPEIVDVEPGDRIDSNHGLALDIGTTTVVGLLVDLVTGDILSGASEMNRQITYGEELVTRISFARDPEGLTKLQKIVVDSINDVVAKITDEAGIDSEGITDVCAGGNTVMNHLLAGIDPSYLEIANVEVPREPIIRKSKRLGLHTNPEAYVYCVPNVSRFLGGDAVGDVLASNMHKSDEISLMVDLGTNGEIVFGNRSWLFSSSCASGPAFEGEGVRHGMRGAEGGIDHLKLDPETYRAEVSVIGGVRPKGICGSGLIDLVSEMFRVGILDFVGKLVHGVTPLVREGKWGLEYVVVPAEETGIGQDIVLTQADLDYVVDSKAAACGAITVLMKKLRIGIEDVRHLYLAGAFGTYTDLDNATRLGIFPEFPNCTVHPIGNGSLSGAYATLMSMEKRGEAREIAEKMVYVDLLVDVEFMEEYSRALYIPGAKEYFPSFSKS